MPGCACQGEHPHRIWSLIYSQSCFQDAMDQCTERRVFYRLISGLPCTYGLPCDDVSPRATFWRALVVIATTETC